MKREKQWTKATQRLLSIVMTMAMLISFCMPVFAVEADDMSLAGGQPELQGEGSLTRVADVKRTGNDSLYVTGRGDFWHGAKWNVKGAVTAPGLYYFAAYVRADDSSVGQTLRYSLNAGSSKWYDFAEVTLASDWTLMTGTAVLEQTQVDAVISNGYADLYPSSGSGNYYIDDVVFVRVDDMAIGNIEPGYQGNGTANRVFDVKHTGNDSLYVTGRGDFWHGATWNAKNVATTAGAYLFSAYVRGDSTSVGQTLRYSLNAGDNKWYDFAEVTLTNGWTRMFGIAVLEQAQIDAIAASAATLYPSSGSGNYYIDDVSFVLADDMTLAKAQPYNQGGGSISRVSSPVHTGKDAILASGRVNIWEGVAWNIPAADLGQLKTNNVWTLSMQARSASGAMNLTYNLEFWYNDGTPNKYLNVSAAITDSEWTELKNTWTLSADYLSSSLDHIVIYPLTGDGQLGNYYLDAVSLTAFVPDDMTIGGSQPEILGTGVLSRDTNIKYTGNDSLLVSGRAENWNGAKWSVKNALTVAGTYQFTAWVRGDAASNGQKLGYTINCAGVQWLSLGEVTLSSDQWTKFVGTAVLTQELVDALAAEGGFADLYPSASDGSAGNYYIDAVSLKLLDSMAILGVEPHAQGGIIERVDTPVHTGNDSLVATNRANVWEGVAWNIPKANLGDLTTNTLWTLSMQARSASGAMNLTYNLEFWYNDGTPNKYLSANAAITDSAWTELTATWQLPSDYLTDGLDHIMIYPVTGDGQLGNYYLDAVSLTGIEKLPEDDMTIGGSQPEILGTGTLTRDNEVKYTGNDSLMVSGRAENWNGAKWSVKNALTVAGTYQFTAWVRGDAASNGQKLGYTINCAGVQWLSLGEVTLSSDQWTKFVGTAVLTQELVDAIAAEGGFADLYPSASDGSFGNYYIDAVSLMLLDSMAILGVEPHAQGGIIERVDTPVHTGNDSLMAANRANIWEGIAWNVPKANLGDLTTNTLWTISMQVRSASGEMNLTYNLEFWYNDGTPNKYLSANAAITDTDWTNLIATWQLPADYLTDGLDHIVIYPITGDGQLSNYYLDAVSLTGTAPVVLDDMTIAGSEPYNQGTGSIDRVDAPVYTGNDSLMAANRSNFWEGVAWSIPVANLGDLATNTLWTISMQARSASGEMNLTYNLEFWYNDGSANKYLSASAVITEGDWTELTATWQLPSDYITDTLDHIVIYPLTGEGQLGNYYLDAVSLTGTAPIVLDDMTIGGCEPYNQGVGAINRVDDPIHSGADAILASGRANPWEGVAWTIPAGKLGDLTTNTTWTLSMWLRSASGKMNMSYSLEFWYTDGSDNKYLRAEAVLNSDEWTQLTGVFDVPASYLKNLDRVVLYPFSGEKQLGDYYVDDVSLTGEPTKVRDNMNIAGCEPYYQGGGSMVRVESPVYSGNDALRTVGRANLWEGVAWSIPAYKLGSLTTNTTWTLSMRLRTVSGSMHMTYSIEFWYSSDVSDCKYLRASANISSGRWTRLSGVFEVPPEYFEGLQRIVIYPFSGEGQLNNYYIDAVSLTGAPAIIRDDMKIGGNGYFVHGDGTLTRTDVQVYTGDDSLLIENRTLPFSGAGWDVTEYLKQEGWGNWFFSAKAMAVEAPMSLHYCIYLRFEDGTEDWLQPAGMYYIKTSEWCDVNTDYAGGDALLASVKGMSHDFSKLAAATLYPCTREGELTPYYLDDVRLYKGSDDYVVPSYTFDSFPLDGTFEEDLIPGKPGCLFLHGEGATMVRTDAQSHAGDYCLKVSDQLSCYSGAGWVITDYLKQEGWGDWYFSAYAKSEAGEEAMGLQYSVYMKFSDGTERWLHSNQVVYLTDRMWQQINVDTAGNPAQLIADNGATWLDFDNLTYAVLYPLLTSDEGTYYIDNVRLWREDPKPEQEDAPPVIELPIEPIEGNNNTGGDQSWLWILPAGVVLLVILILIILIVKRKKNKDR